MKLQPVEMPNSNDLCRHADNPQMSSTPKREEVYSPMAVNNGLRHNDLQRPPLSHSIHLIIISSPAIPDPRRYYFKVADKLPDPWTSSSITCITPGCRRVSEHAQSGQPALRIPTSRSLLKHGLKPRHR